MIAALAAVVGEEDAAVGTGQHALGIFRVDPQRPKITEGLAERTEGARLGQRGPRPAAVARVRQRFAGDENVVGIAGIHANLVEGVTGFAAQVVARGIHFAPRSPGIVGAVDLAADQSRAAARSTPTAWLIFVGGHGAAIAVVDDGVEEVGVFLVEIEADAADGAGGQAAFQSLPGGAAIGGFVNPAAGSAVRELPGIPHAVVSRGVKRLGMSSIEDQIDRACLVH